MGGVSLVIIFLCIFIFSFILFIGSYFFSFFFSRTGREDQHRDFYECGFKPISDNRVLFDVHFSIVGLIFLIYEMEIVLFVPIFLNLGSLTFFYTFFFIFSLFILGLSYYYEWEKYGLDWFF